LSKKFPIILIDRFLCNYYKIILVDNEHGANLAIFFIMAKMIIDAIANYTDILLNTAIPFIFAVEQRFTIRKNVFKLAKLRWKSLTLENRNAVYP